MGPFHALPGDFGTALLQNTEATSFFQSCTPEQQQVILHQAAMLRSQQDLNAFVAHLPSAAL